MLLWWRRCTELDAEHAAALEEVSNLNDALSTQRSHCQKLRESLFQAEQQVQQLQQQHATPPCDARGAGHNSRVSWQHDSRLRDQRQGADHDASHVDGSRFEESVGGGLATSTPSHFGLHPPETAQQAIQEKNTLIGLYKDRLDRCEEENEQLRNSVHEAQAVEQELRER
jgi:uncharacterized coiled-coil protein SlyX